MATYLIGLRTVTLTRDEQGYREYRIKYLVGTDARGVDSVGTALNTPGLPVPGSAVQLLGEIDPWAWIRPQATVSEHGVNEGEPVEFFAVEMTGSNKPPTQDKGGGDQPQGCDEHQVEDPLLEPQKVSGSYVGDKEEATHDRFGKPVITSSHEQIRGPQNEWDKGRDQVVIEQNVADLELDVVSGMKDTLNDAELWGLPVRAVKLSSYSWDRKFHGACHVYYTRKFTFDIKVKISEKDGELVGDWDREILDEGTKVLHGHWDETTGAWTLDNINGIAPDKHNPLHFDRFKDKNGENCRVILDGNGKPASAVAGISGLFLNHGGGPAGAGLGDSRYWVPLNSPVDAVFAWRANTYYIRGALVLHTNGITYVALVDDPDEYQNPEADPLFTDANWQAVTPVYKGEYAAGTTYVAGDYVYGTADVAGKVRVEKYQESNFLLLQIPTSF